MGTWIKEPPRNMSSNENYLFVGDSQDGFFNGNQYRKVNFLWNESNIYVMDNHLAAGWCWIQQCHSDKYSFLHIDQHTDDLYRFPLHFDINKFKMELCNMSFEEYCQLCYNENGLDIQIFQCESYIRPIAKLFPHFFTKCYFAIHQTHNLEVVQRIVKTNNYKDDLNNPLIISQSNLLEFRKTITNSDSKWIINLDLDYLFNDDEQIIEFEFFEQLGNLLYSVKDKIEVITVALSPTWCNGLRNSLLALEAFRNSYPEMRNFNIIDYL